MARLIEMANLAGKIDLQHVGLNPSAWESTAGLLLAVIELDDPLRSHLIGVMNEPEREPWTTAIMVKAGFKVEAARLYCQARAVSDRFELIRAAQNTLERVVAEEEHFPATIFIERRKDEKGKHKARYAADEITQPLIDADDLRDIRRCAVCEKFFFRRRLNSMVCDPESKCAATYSKRQERKNATERKRLAELAAENAAKKKSPKTKRAKTARKR